MKRSLAQDVPSTAKEERRLACLESFVAHEQVEPGDRELPLTDDSDSGLILANRDGNALYLSLAARRLLFLAVHETIGPDGAPDRPPRLPAAVVRICRALSDVVAGKAEVSPHCYRHRNKWGGFVFRAYSLEGADAASALIGITISREEPLAQRLMRLTKGLGLTRRQAQICVLLALGLSYGAIGHRLQISEHTVIAHGRWIYDKLDVHNRVELVHRLHYCSDFDGKPWQSGFNESSTAVACH